VSFWMTCERGVHVQARYLVKRVPDHWVLGQGLIELGPRHHPTGRVRGAWMAK